MGIIRQALVNYGTTTKAYTVISVDFGSIQSLTPSNLLSLVEHAIAKILLGGQVRGINGRMLTEADLSQLTEFRDKLIREINDAANGSGIALVQYGERV